jgi:hypothetical protein
VATGRSANQAIALQLGPQIPLASWYSHPPCLACCSFWNVNNGASLDSRRGLWAFTICFVGRTSTPSSISGNAEEWWISVVAKTALISSFEPTLCKADLCSIANDTFRVSYSKTRGARPGGSGVRFAGLLVAKRLEIVQIGPPSVD